MMKKNISRLSAAIAAIGSALFGILWLNNLVSSLRYHQLLMSGADNLAVTSLAPGLWPALDWSAVDVSTITTFIPFFGFVLILHGLFRIRHHEEWPFFAGYERLNIALGLIGTIWGIILVGYYPADQISIASLMRCLHTAMFSTLAAVLWVMVIIPAVVKPWLDAVRRAECGRITEADSFTEVAAEFVSGINAAGESLKSGALEMTAFHQGLAETNREFAKLLETVNTGRAAEEAWRRSAAEGIAAFSAAAAELAARQETLAAENRKLAERGHSLETELAAAETQVAELKRQLETIRRILG
ncbi:MAG: hypothetical protein AB7F32_07200 [Victivallaceae bacterium]